MLIYYYLLWFKIEILVLESIIRAESVKIMTQKADELDTVC